MRSSVSLRVLTIVFVIAALVSSCQSSRPVHYVEVREITKEVEVFVVVTTTPIGTESSVVDATTVPPPTEAPPPTAIAVDTLAPSPSPTFDPFPTPARDEIIVAEQLFENGRMFWLQPNQQIWIMIYGENAASGQWLIGEDTWFEGMMEFDAAIIPPEGFFQPERGFGKLWRDDETIRNLLGWALDNEYGHVTTYGYFSGGEVVDGQYIPGPGYHTLNSRYDGVYIFYEVDRTWQRAPE